MRTCLLLLTMLGEFEEIPCKDTYQNSCTQTQVAKFKRTSSWLLSANCRIAERSQLYRRESRVLYEIIFVAFHWFRILIHDHLLILTHAYIHDDIVSAASSSRPKNQVEIQHPSEEQYQFHPICPKTKVSRIDHDSDPTSQNQSTTSLIKNGIIYKKQNQFLAVKYSSTLLNRILRGSTQSKETKVI